MAASSSSSTTSRVLPPVSTVGIPPDLCMEMYNAVTEGHLAAVESLLGRDGSLAWRVLTEEGEKALHVACSKKHVQLIARLVTCLSADEVASHDGLGYTASCYVAMCGAGGADMVDAMRSMVEPYPALLTLQSWYGTDPCMLAVEYGSVEVLSYLTGLSALTEAKWFDLLLHAIDNKNFDSALAILEKKGGLAEMKREADQRTPLHILAQLDVSPGWKVEDERKMRRDFKVLSEKLWDNMQNLGRDGLVSMIIDPPLLHDASNLGNIDLVKLILKDHPDLMFRFDAHGRNLLHTIVTSRRVNMLSLVKHANNLKFLDKEKNNLLHYAAKSAEKKEVDLKAAHQWFTKVELVVPPQLKEMENKNGDLPSELFWKEHGELVAEQKAYAKRRAEASMIITTVAFTSVFAAAFAPPGGYNQQGVPLLLHRGAFQFFVAFEIMALYTSGLSLLGFLHVVTSRRGEYYQAFIMPRILNFSMFGLMLTLVFVVGSFLSHTYLSLVKENPPILRMMLLVPSTTFIIQGLAFWIVHKFVRPSIDPLDHKGGPSGR